MPTANLADSARLSTSRTALRAASRPLARAAAASSTPASGASMLMSRSRKAWGQMKGSILLVKLRLREPPSILQLTANS